MSRVACSAGTYSFIALFVTASISGFFFTLPRWKGMNDGQQPQLSSFFLFSLCSVRKSGRMEGSQAAHQSFHRERESDGVLRKWRCRRLGLAKGSPSRNTHTHTHRGRITLIYLARQQLASVCSVLTPAQPNCYWSFSSPWFCCVCVCAACVRVFVSRCTTGSWSLCVDLHFLYLFCMSAHVGGPL